MVAQNTDLRASLALGTVKKRIRMCGRPAVPNISAMPNETAEIGSLMKVPGPMIASFFSCTSTDFANSASGLKLNCAITTKAMKDAPPSSKIALMICTQVVAVIPPNSTYTIISVPTSTTAIQYSRPNSSLIS